MARKTKKRALEQIKSLTPTQLLSAGPIADAALRAQKRKARRKAAKRRAFAKLVAVEVAKILRTK